MTSNSITIIIVAIILVLFIKSILPNSTRSFKNEIVSLGVLGTFIGIAIGLFHFDVTQIKESMPILLGGLKTAFITSGVGIDSLNSFFSSSGPERSSSISNLFSPIFNHFLFSFAAFSIRHLHARIGPASQTPTTGAPTEPDVRISQLAVVCSAIQPPCINLPPHVPPQPLLPYFRGLPERITRILPE